MSRQNHGAHICSFEAVNLERGDLSDYELFRHKVLLAGRFSVFEATENHRRAALFTRLCSDPEVVTDKSCGFPWTKVSLRASGIEGEAGDPQGLHPEGESPAPKGDAQ